MVRGCGGGLRVFKIKGLFVADRRIGVAFSYLCMVVSSARTSFFGRLREMKQKSDF